MPTLPGILLSSLVLRACEKALRNFELPPLRYFESGGQSGKKKKKRKIRAAGESADRELVESVEVAVDVVEALFTESPRLDAGLRDVRGGFRAGKTRLRGRLTVFRVENRKSCCRAIKQRPLI